MRVAKAAIPNLVIVSLGMRGFDGLRLCSQLRSLPEGRNVPILVVVSRKATGASSLQATGNGRQ